MADRHDDARSTLGRIFVSRNDPVGTMARIAGVCFAIYILTYAFFFSLGFFDASINPFYGILLVAGLVLLSLYAYYR